MYISTFMKKDVIYITGIVFLKTLIYNYSYKNVYI